MKFFDPCVISTFDKGEAAGLGIFINADFLIDEAGLGAVVEAGDAFKGEDEGVGEDVPFFADSFDTEAVESIVVLQEGDRFLTGVEAVETGLGVKIRKFAGRASVEVLHGTLDTIGVAEAIGVVAEVVPGGPAHLEIEEAIESNVLVVVTVGILAQLAGVTVIDFAKKNEVFRPLAYFFAEALAEFAPELVVDVFYGIDAEAVDADFLNVEAVDPDEFIDEFIKVNAVVFGPNITKAEEVAVDFFSIGFLEALVIEALATVSREVSEDAVEFDMLPEDLLGFAGLGFEDVPFGNVSPFRAGVESFFLKGGDPFAFFVKILGAIAVLVVEKERADVITDDVLDDLDPFFVSEPDEVPVMGEAPVSVVRIGFASKRNRGGEMRVDIEEVLSPVSVVARLAGIAFIVGRLPDVPHRWGDPDGGDAECIKVAALKREFDAAEIATVVKVDIFLLGVVGRGVAALGKIV